MALALLENTTRPAANSPGTHLAAQLVGVGTAGTALGGLLREASEQAAILTLTQGQA